MDIVRLETFLLLSQVGSFTEVANQLYCSQPAVSKQIKTLEEDLGVPLFNRIGKNNHLTIQGKYFLPYAQEIVNTYARAKEHILQLENLEEGTIRFGATNFIGVYLIPEILAIFRKRFPKIEVEFTISSSKKLIALLQNDAIEFAFLSGYIHLVPERFIIQKVCDDKLKVIVNTNHPLANKDKTNFVDIQNETFILKGESSSLYKFLQERISETAFKNNVMLKISSQEGIKEAVIQNLGISVMSEKAVKHEMDLGLIKTLDLENIDLVRSINLVYNKKHNLTPAAKEFFKCLKC